MWPVLGQLSVFGVTRPIGSYGVMLACATLLAACMLVSRARRAGHDVGQLIAITAITVGAGLLGANLLFALIELLRTGEVSWLSGRFGLVFWGGALGGAAGLFAACRWLGVRFVAVIDHAVLPLAVAHAIGRVGCLLGGCCYGVEWHGLDGHGLLAIHAEHPWAPSIAAVPRAPIQLLEGALVVVLALGLSSLRRAGRLRAPGALAQSYALGYAALRLGLEGLRGDGARGVMFDGWVSSAQVLSVIVIVGVLAWPRFSMRRAWLGLAVIGMVGSSLWHLRGQARAQLSIQAPAVVHVGAGWFTMGSGDPDVAAAVALCRLDADRPDLCVPEAFANEVPSRRVYLSAFGIDRTEVSYAAYRRCVAANVCTPSRVSDADSRVSDPSHPVTGITFKDAVRYCAWVGGTLPTEAQWEKAARGTTPRTFPWGNLWNSRLANHGRGLGAEDPIDGYSYAAPVNAFVDARSPYGVLNMAGNVAEMVADYYDERGYADAERMDPRGPAQGSERVVRGGSWHSPAFTLRTTHRAHMGESETPPDVGFRCSYAP